MFCGLDDFQKPKLFSPLPFVSSSHTLFTATGTTYEITLRMALQGKEDKNMLSHPNGDDIENESPN